MLECAKVLGMKKSHAFELLGGTAAEVARACRITPSAVSQWPDELTKDQVDRVQAALWRKQLASTASEAASVHPITPTTQEITNG